MLFFLLHSKGKSGSAPKFVIELFFQHFCTCYNARGKKKLSLPSVRHKTCVHILESANGKIVNIFFIYG